MMEKIAWYQEVLEQDPASRVFFPLARLLFNDKRLEEAAAILRNGLIQHPDFLEARLFLIQILADCEQLDECHLEAAKVSKLLHAYPAFLKAWSQIAINKEQEVIIRLIGVLFQYPAAALSDVLELGLDSLDKKETIPVVDMEDCPVLQDISELPVPEILVEDFVEEAEDMPPLQDMPLEDPDSLPEEKEIPSQAAPAFPDTLDELPPLESIDLPDPIEALEQLGSLDQLAQLEPVTFDEPVAAEMPVAAAQPAVETQTVIEDEPVASPDSFAAPDPIEELASPGPIDSFAQVDSPDDADDLETSLSSGALHAFEESVGSSELITLRTRSMAEVLADQGDVAGALEIYQELEAAAPTPEEARILHERVLALVARIGKEGGAADVKTIPQPVAAPVAPEPSAAAPQEDHLKSLLESLATRLEARARA